MDLGLWPFLFFCLNGCYGPPQMLRGQVAHLPEASTRAAPVASLATDEPVRLAGEIGDPSAWAERVFTAGRPDLRPSVVIDLHRRGVPLAHLDALYGREMRARDADCASRVAGREQQLARRCNDELHRLRQVQPPGYPVYPYGQPYPGYWPGWR